MSKFEPGQGLAACLPKLFRGCLLGLDARKNEIEHKSQQCFSYLFDLFNLVVFGQIRLNDLTVDYDARLAIHLVGRITSSSSDIIGLTPARIEFSVTSIQSNSTSYLTERLA